MLHPAPFFVPIVKVEDVFLFPGVPAALQLLFSAWKEALRQDPFHLARLELDADEGAIAPHLRRVQETHAAVEIGSYPRFEAGAPYKVLVTVEGKDRGAVLAAAEAVAGGLEPGTVLAREGPSPPEAGSFVA